MTGVPYTKGTFGHRNRHVQREDDVKTQVECHLPGALKTARKLSEARRET